jgi:hypothetical protein
MDSEIVRHEQRIWVDMMVRPGMFRFKDLGPGPSGLSVQLVRGVHYECRLFPKKFADGTETPMNMKIFVESSSSHPSGLPGTGSLWAMIPTSHPLAYVCYDLLLFQAGDGVTTALYPRRFPRKCAHKAVDRCRMSGELRWPDS